MPVRHSRCKQSQRAQSSSSLSLRSLRLCGYFQGGYDRPSCLPQLTCPEDLPAYLWIPADHNAYL